MNFSESLTEIESDNFAALVNIASGYNLFFSFAGQQNVVQELWKELASPTQQEALLKRIKKLAAEEHDLQYCNPRDVAFTIYLWLLSLRNPELAQQAAEVIAKVPQGGWMEDAAYFFLQTHKPLSEAPDTPVDSGAQ
jgi:hypothetical protein